MKKRINTPIKKVAVFYLIYFLVMSSLVYVAIWSSNKIKEVKVVDQSVVEHSQMKNEQIENKEGTPSKWKPSEKFTLTAVTAASIADVVIILLWARHENKKRENESNVQKKRWAERKWFWHIVAMGIVQPKENKLVINWRNFILFIITMYLIKKYLFQLLIKDESFAELGLLVRNQLSVL
jgi:hypothetical protein